MQGYYRLYLWVPSSGVQLISRTPQGEACAPVFLILDELPGSLSVKRY